MTETLSGIITAIAIIAIYQLLSRHFTIKLFASSILVAIAFIYVGFALKGNTVSVIIPEIVVALIFYFTAIIGYTRNASLIAYGIIVHGVWDIFHHGGVFIKTDIPVYWPSFCFVVDIIDGLYFLFVFNYKKRVKLLSVKSS